jgi:hypothetical protein
MVWHGTARCGKARRGQVWRGTAWRGAVWPRIDSMTSLHDLADTIAILLVCFMLATILLVGVDLIQIEPIVIILEND